MADDPDNLTLRILREIRENMATKTDIATINDRIDRFSLAVATDIRDLDNQVANLREAVMHYHSSVLGHGIIIGELEARVRRMERHLNLDTDS